MRHVGAYHRNILSFRQSGAGVVERLIKSKGSSAASLNETLKILDSKGGANHRSQRGGVWRDHQIFAQSAFKAEAGNAKAGILVGEIYIPSVVSRLRNPPRHAALLSILNLP